MHLFLLIWFFQSVALANRKPAQFQDHVKQFQTLFSQVQDSRSFNQENCTQFINPLADLLYDLPSDWFIPKGPAEETWAKEIGPKLIKDLFLIRLHFEARLSQFSNPSQQCVVAVRRASRYARFADEFFSEWLVAKGVFTLPDKVSFKSGFPARQMNKGISEFELKPGDVLLVRGSSFVSSMIARVGDEDADFSHLAIVGLSPEGHHVVVESLLQSGVVLHPITDYSDEIKSRLVILRAKDSDLAKKSARAIYDYVYERRNRPQKLRYDFAMSDADHNEMFCSEVVQFAYKLGSTNSVILPRFKTNFSEIYDHPFFRDLGIRVRDGFSPSDLAFDPRFYTVAEFRDLRNLRTLRRDDAIFSSVYHWMSTMGYSYTTDHYNFRSLVAWLGIQTGLVANQLQKHAPKSIVEVMMKSKRLHEILAPRLEQVESQFIKERGFSRVPREIRQTIEQWRADDCRVSPRRISSFHWLISAPTCAE